MQPKSRDTVWSYEEISDSKPALPRRTTLKVDLPLWFGPPSLSLPAPSRCWLEWVMLVRHSWHTEEHRGREMGHGKRKELCTSLSKGRLYKCCLLPVCDIISVAVSHLGLYYKQEVNNEVLKDMCIGVVIRTGMEGWLKELFFSSSTNQDTCQSIFPRAVWFARPWKCWIEEKKKESGIWLKFCFREKKWRFCLGRVCLRSLMRGTTHTSLHKHSRTRSQTIQACQSDRLRSRQSAEKLQNSLLIMKIQSPAVSKWLLCIRWYALSLSAIFLILSKFHSSVFCLTMISIT